MKFSIEKSTLENIILKLGKLLDKGNSTVEVLEAGVKVAVSTEAIQLYASNGSVSVVVNEGLLDAEKGRTDLIIEKTGDAIIPKHVFKVLKKFKKGLITFESIGDAMISVYQKRTKIDFSTFNSEEFPMLLGTDTQSLKAQFFMSFDEFKSLPMRTVHAISESSTSHPILTGIKFDFQVNPTTQQVAYKVYATDSSRLSHVKSNNVPFSEQLSTTSCVIDGQLMAGYLKGHEEKNKFVQVQIHSSRAVLVAGDLTLGNLGNHTMLMLPFLVGTFPNVEGIMKKVGTLLQQKQPITAIFNKDELYNSLEITRALENSKDSIITLQPNTTHALLESRVENGSTSKVYDEMELHAGSQIPQSFKICFNTDMAQKALRALSSEHVKMTFTGALEPITITAVNEVATTDVLNEPHIEIILPVKSHETAGQ